MVDYKRFRLLNNVAAWSIFAIALLTYWLTLEPTASYWDCPEYIAVADKMQVGHSPGNPIWMLAARFAVNFSPDASHKALMVNALSGLFTALAVMVLYRTIVMMLLYGRYGSRRVFQSVGTISQSELIATLGAGAVGSLAFCWSDSVWFSAVEAEVYAFSIFMTALSIWVTLRWAFAEYSTPHADRWLILAAYLIGAGMGVHELNLLCIPPMALIVWHRIRRGGVSFGSWVALALGCLAVAGILFLFIPGFLRFAKAVELWMVNRMHLPFNSGLFAAWLILFLLLWGGATALSLTSRGGKALRIVRLALWCGAMVFTGYSSYALIVIRGAADPPVNTGAPGDIFSFASYYAREQYGSAPLLRGYAFGAPRLRVESTDSTGKKRYRTYYNTEPSPRYVAARHGDKAVLRNGFATSADSLQAAADSRRNDDFYLMSDYAFTSEKTPEMMMWLPRMYSDNPDDISGYYNWSGMSREDMVRITSPTLAVDSQGNPIKSPDLPADTLYRPDYLHNFAYLAGYQVGFMYLRYFLWNFGGRQNDAPGHGEPDCGLPATGLERLDAQWCGPIDKMPADAGRDNPGRNIYFFLPLLLGLAGMVWQSIDKGRDRRCAAVVAALFFFTGLAIVLYLNQPPTQARDRDYAFLGSYYAFCIWIGLGVMPLWQLMRRVLSSRRESAAAGIAVGLALIVPVQMLSQTFDDHDRSGRTATTDMAHNILAPLPRKAILFVDGDNSTFPLWYMQATEEERRDVRIVSLTYLSDARYAASLRNAVWDAAPLALAAPDSHLRMGRYAYASLAGDSTWRDAREVLREFYATQSSAAFPRLSASRVYVPFGSDTLRVDLRRCKISGNIVRQDLILLLDIISSAAASDSRPKLYWIASDGDGVFNGQLTEAFRLEGPVNRLAPGHTAPDDAKILSDFERLYRSGGADNPRTPYYDPLTARRIAEIRKAMILHAANLSRDSSQAADALRYLHLIQKRLPDKAVPYQAYMLPDSTYSDEGADIALALVRASHASADPAAVRREAMKILRRQLATAEQWQRYRESLPESWREFLSTPRQAYADEAPRLRQLLDSVASLAPPARSFP